VRTLKGDIEKLCTFVKPLANTTWRYLKLFGVSVWHFMKHVWAGFIQALFEMRERIILWWHEGGSGFGYRIVHLALCAAFFNKAKADAWVLLHQPKKSITFTSAWHRLTIGTAPHSSLEALLNRTKSRDILLEDFLTRGSIGSPVWLEALEAYVDVEKTGVFGYYEAVDAVVRRHFLSSTGLDYRTPEMVTIFMAPAFRKLREEDSNFTELPDSYLLEILKPQKNLV
jgi:hypothetical protein